MGDKLPTRLKNDPLVGVLFELRFSSDLPIVNILPGILFSKLGCSKIDKTQHAEIPDVIRNQNEALAYLPVVKIIWGDYIILLGNKALALECRLPYKGWGDFREKIISFLTEINTVSLPMKIHRYSLKYIDILNFEGSPVIGDKLNVKFSLGNAEWNLAGTHIKTQTVVEDVSVVIQLAGSAGAHFEDGTSRKGFLVDTDTICNINQCSLNEFMPKLSDGISHLHDVNKRLFFSYLTQGGLDMLEPEYD